RLPARRLQVLAVRTNWPSPFRHVRPMDRVPKRSQIDTEVDGSPVDDAEDVACLLDCAGEVPGLNRLDQLLGLLADQPDTELGASDRREVTHQAAERTVHLLDIALGRMHLLPHHPRP